MRLKAEISLELDACDFIEAAEHQKRLEQFLLSLKGAYPGASMKFWERRERTGAPAEGRGRPKKLKTGRVSAYTDVTAGTGLDDNA